MKYFIPLNKNVSNAIFNAQYAFDGNDNISDISDTLSNKNIFKIADIIFYEFKNSTSSLLLLKKCHYLAVILFFCILAHQKRTKDSLKLLNHFMDI